MAHRFWSVPIVGLFFGCVAGLAFLLADQVFSSLVAALLALLFVHGLNRFLHVDGLSDLGDGLLAGGSKEKKLAAMKDSRSGAGGIAYLFFFESLSVLALAMFANQPLALLFLIPLMAEVLAKNALVACASVGKPSEGMGGIFVRNAKGGTAFASAVLSFFIISVLGYFLKPYSGWSDIWVVVIGLSLVLVSSLVGAVLAKLAMRSFGIVNGDVLGATNEIARPIVLMTLVLVIRCLESVRW